MLHPIWTCRLSPLSAPVARLAELGGAPRSWIGRAAGPFLDRAGA